MSKSAKQSKVAQHLSVDNAASEEEFSSQEKFQEVDNVESEVDNAADSIIIEEDKFNESNIIDVSDLLNEQEDVPKKKSNSSNKRTKTNTRNDSQKISSKGSNTKQERVCKYYNMLKEKEDDIELNYNEEDKSNVCAKFSEMLQVISTELGQEMYNWLQILCIHHKFVITGTIQELPYICEVINISEKNYKNLKYELNKIKSKPLQYIILAHMMECLSAAGN